MRFTYSIIVSTRDAKGTSLAWHRGQINSEIQTIIVENPGRLSLGQAWNQGLASVEAEYCCFLHDDVEVKGEQWLPLLRRGIDDFGFDLVGIAGTTRMPRTGGWWDSGRGFGRGSITHRHPGGRESHDQYGPPDDPRRGISSVVSLDGVLLFGRRRDFLSAPFDSDLFDGFHFYDSDLSLRWLLWHGRKLGVVHGIDVVHRAGASLAGWQNLLDRFHHRHGAFLPLDLRDVATWQANLTALRHRSPKMADRLILSHRPGQLMSLSRQPDHQLVGNAGNRDFVIADDLGGEVELRDWVVLQGIGNGKWLESLLASSVNRIVVIEPESQLLCWLLCRHDWSAALRSGRLQFIIESADQAALTEMSLHECVNVLQQEIHDLGEPTWIPSGSYSVHRAFHDSLRKASGLTETMGALVRTWAPSKESTFAATVVSPQCEIFNDLADALQAAGCPTRRLDVPDRAEDWTYATAQSLLKSLVESPTAVTFIRNRACFEMPNPRERVLLEPLVPGRLVSWWWDVPTATTRADWENPASRRPALGFAREIVSILPEGSRWLPPAARSLFTSAAPEFGEEGRDIPLSFVGQSRFGLLRQNLDVLGNGLYGTIGLAGLRWAGAINRSRSMASLYQAIVSRRADMKGAIEQLSAAFPLHARYFDYLFNMSETAAFRLAAVESLRDFPIIIYGDEGWVASGAIRRDQFIGTILPSALPLVYRRTKLNLNFNFMQVSSTVNPKVLDIAASGNAVLTDERPELVDLFPEPASRPPAFQTLEELPDRVSTLLNSDLSGLRQRSREAVLAEHTMKHRALWLIREFGLPGGK